MAELLAILQQVKARIDRYGSKGINEQDTKAALLQPVLRSLGWDVEDLDDVQREYKIRKQDKPVDFALFLLRTPCLFVEAKGLGQNLDDRKWANQIMGYAGVAGVGWVVLTDGNEYRLYNSHAPVPIEEKLFRTLRITDDLTNACQTLELLSKERMRENEIDVLWKAHFVDRQVKAAVRELFSSTPDQSVVRLVAKKVPALSAKEVRASLQRASLSFDFPIRPGTGANDAKNQSIKRTKKVRVSARPEGRLARRLGVRPSELVMILLREGILSERCEITAEYKQKTLRATIEPDGQSNFRGAKYKSPSAAGAAAKAFISGKYTATDGWSFWNYSDGGGKKVALSTAREVYLSTRSR